MRNTNKKLNRNKKLLTKIIVAGTLLTAGASTLIYTNKVDAKALPVATTKDYNKLQKLSNKSGTNYAKTKKWYIGFMPGENVQAIRDAGTYKLTGVQSDPGVRNWSKYIGAGTFGNKQYFIGIDASNYKYLMPAEYCKVPYAYKLKSSHEPVYAYLGSLENAYNGYSSFLDDYGHLLTKQNVIYPKSQMKVTLDNLGQNTGKYKGFWIGKTPITFNVAGDDEKQTPTTETQEMYPLYIYNPTGELTVSYIKVEDLDQFEPATVKYNNIGTITNKHAFKPVDKKLDF